MTFLQHETQNQYEDNCSENIEDSFSSNDEKKPPIIILESKLRERITITPIKQNNSKIKQDNIEQNNFQKNSKNNIINENFSKEPQNQIRVNKFRANLLFKDSINEDSMNDIKSFGNNCLSGHFYIEEEKKPKNSERTDDINFPNPLSISNSSNLQNYINDKKTENNKNNIYNIYNGGEYQNHNDNDYFEDNIQFTEPLENDNILSNNLRDSKIFNMQINKQDNNQKDIFHESINYNNVNFYNSNNTKKEKNKNNIYDKEKKSNNYNNYNIYKTKTNYGDSNLFNEDSLYNIDNFIKQEKKETKNENKIIINQNDPSILFSDLKPIYSLEKLKIKNKINSNRSSETYDPESPRDNYRKKIKIITINNNNIKQNCQSFCNLHNSNNNNIPHKMTKLNNSYGANLRNKKKIKRDLNKIKSGGERLYSEYLIHLPHKRQKIENLKKELENEEIKELSFIPKINRKSKQIASRKNSPKVEDRLLSFGEQKKQKYLISKINQDLKNTIENTFSPKINEVSRYIAETNRKNRIKKVYDYKNKKTFIAKIDLQEKFGKRARSLSNSRNKYKKLKNKLLNEYIDFEGNNNDLSKISNKEISYLSNISSINEKNNKINYCVINLDVNKIKENDRNENDISEDKEQIIKEHNRLNKTSDLNKAFNELYNSLDEKDDLEISKFFTDCKLDNDLNDQKDFSKNNERYFFVDDKNSINNNYKVFKPEKNNFDVLYLETTKQNKKKLKNNEISENEITKKYFQPEISPCSKQLNKNNRESKKEFYDRISKKLEHIQKEIKLINSSKGKNIKNSKNNSPKNLDITIKRNKKCEFERKNKENITLKRIESQNNKEKEEIYNGKSKEVIMKMKITKYKQLFDLLDSDKDGLISFNNIKLTKINGKTLNSLSPILDYLYNTGDTINFREFCIKFDKILMNQ